MIFFHDHRLFHELLKRPLGILVRIEERRHEIPDFALRRAVGRRQRHEGKIGVVERVRGVELGMNNGYGKAF
ncbi:hypothetical protein TorRG33x02_216330 [Trema orientale]|uniref:Uncharacterized protein n=1 Tax=Trema orientale TaxID=63057 RepID=A0A2P5EAH2_TREOI|nr:hypothetical protein TorRG33x02_216330 [Trema orientale]